MGACCSKDSASQPEASPPRQMEECAWSRHKTEDCLHPADRESGRLNPSSNYPSPLYFCTAHYPSAAATYWSYKNLEKSIMPLENDFRQLVFKRDTAGGRSRFREIIRNIDDAEKFAIAIDRAVQLRKTLQRNIKSEVHDTGHIFVIYALEELAHDIRDR